MSTWSDNFSANFGNWGWSAREAGQGHKGGSPSSGYTRVIPKRNIGSGDMSGVLSKLEAEQKAANETNLARYQDILKLSDKIAGIYAPGGAFGKGFEAQLQRSKKQTVAGGMQQLVSSGLSNTTNAAGLGQQFEENVGAPSRLKLEDLRMDRYSSALGAKQGFMERRTDSGPDYGMVGQYANLYGQGLYR